MNSYTDIPIRDRIRRILATATEPVTTRRLGELAGTTHAQAARALRQLEDAGAAVRQPAVGGAYEWSATRR